ncbi:hypothetical protein KFK09_003671 [Dendrobium nobile]|uniref:Uncharacterized protein n=1 Tax=Dendrobium nobile TaxID=94219 RepID=A0A8T3C376_DENNO|nr:hypothetical protein KFK09_003671 [Dendrobium nobile]
MDPKGKKVESATNFSMTSENMKKFADMVAQMVSDKLAKRSGRSIKKSGESSRTRTVNLLVLLLELIIVLLEPFPLLSKLFVLCILMYIQAMKALYYLIIGLGWYPGVDAGAGTGRSPRFTLNSCSSSFASSYPLCYERGCDGGAEASTSLDEFLTGALAQVPWPPDTSDKAATFGTQPAAKFAGTTGNIPALQSEPGAEAGTSSSFAKFVVGNILAQVALPPELCYEAIPLRTRPADKKVENLGTISALQSEPGAEVETSEIFSMPVASQSESGKTPESPPPASPPLPPLQGLEE